MSSASGRRTRDRRDPEQLLRTWLFRERLLARLLDRHAISQELVHKLLPYLGCSTAEDPAYVRTRRLVLSEDNPYFFRGKAAEGVGGPHVGLRMICLGITMRALTSTNDGEILACLRTLKSTHAGTGFMHEAFDEDDPARFTRKWLAWVNTLFGELVLKVPAERPHLLRERL